MEIESTTVVSISLGEHFLAKFHLFFASAVLDPVVKHLSGITVIVQISDPVPVLHLGHWVELVDFVFGDSVSSEFFHDSLSNHGVHLGDTITFTEGVISIIHCFELLIVVFLDGFSSCSSLLSKFI